MQLTKVIPIRIDLNAGLHLLQKEPIKSKRSQEGLQYTAVRNAMLRYVRKGLVLIGIMIVFKVDLLSLKITLPN